MFRKFLCAALTLWAATAANRSLAENSGFEGPPPWRDSASVYLNLDRTTSDSPTTDTVKSESPAQPAALVSEKIATPQPVTEAPQLAPTPQPPAFDSEVQHAMHESIATAAPNDTQRRLPPPTVAAAPSASQSAHAVAARQLPNLSLRWDSISTSVSALGAVIGCFLFCTWLVRRGSRKSTGALPRDVVSVLGRVPLAARNVAQLLRVGNKLVLVSLTPAGAETLTEITDPAEVDRLVGLCHQSDPHSTTKAFEHVFRQMSLEPAPTGFLGPESYRGHAARG
jgi:flagellar biogenesis protein FliO